MAIPKAHLWEPGKPPPKIRPHSLAKHRLMDAYLRRYVATLTQRITVDRLPLTVVDGFAGGNIYVDPTDNETRGGSPSIILDALREAEALANVRRNKPFKLLSDCFFIEKDQGAFDSLKATLLSGPHSQAVGETVHPIKGDFIAYASEIVKFIKGKSRTGKSIFILDQFGYSQVPFQIVRDIFQQIPHAEVILTFAAGYLIDHLRGGRANPALRKNPDLDLNYLASKTDKGNPLWKRLIQSELHAEVQRQTGAKFFTPFFIRSIASHRDLWLVHLSRHHRARDVMVGVHWDIQNCFAHYGKAGLDMLGYSPNEDISITGQPTFEAFLFDAIAEERTKAALAEDLPKLLCDTLKEVDFRTLFSNISNQTPATSRLLGAAIHALSEEGRVIIRDASKLVTRRAGLQHETDLIIVPPQRQFFFGFPSP